MPFLILLLFIGIPIAEIALLIQVAGIIDLLPTIGLIIFTAILGVYLLRQQGLSSINRAQRAMDEGRLPVDSVVDAVALLVSGAFLLTPGLITDSLGFLLLVPQIRHGLARYLLRKAKESKHVHVDIFGTGMEGERREDPGFDPRAAQGGRRPPPGKGPVIEGEALEPEHEQDVDSGPPDDKSPWRRG